MLLLIPTEILYFISSFLHFNDIKSLSAVCTQLWYALDSVTVFRNRKIKAIRRLPTSSNPRIIRKTICNISFSASLLPTCFKRNYNSDLNTIKTRFPNLGGLTLDRLGDGKKVVPSDLNPFLQCNIKSLRLEGIESFLSLEKVFTSDEEGVSGRTVGFTPLSYYIGHFKRLEELSITILPANQNKKALGIFIDCLKKLPNLRDLELNGFSQMFGFLDQEKCQEMRNALLYKRNLLTSLTLVNTDMYGDHFEDVFLKGRGDQVLLPKRFSLLQSSIHPLSLHSREKMTHVEYLTIDARVPILLYSNLPYLVSLTLTAFHTFDGAIFECKPCLRDLTFKCCFISFETMDNVFKYCPQLLTLRFQECWFEADGRLWIGLAVKLPKLVQLDLEMCINVKGNYLSYIFRDCHGAWYENVALRKMHVNCLSKDPCTLFDEVADDIRKHVRTKMKLRVRRQAPC